MTREEAIKLIKALKNGLHETGKDFPYRDEIIPVAKQALDMAIKALEQESCNECRKDILPKYEAKVITRGNCMMCGKELTEGIFFCKECEDKAESEGGNDD